MKQLFLVVVLLLSLSLDGQAPSVQWQNTFGGVGHDDLRAMLMTEDGGFLLGGYSNSNVSGEKADSSKGLTDFWILKLDADRSIEWQRTVGGSDMDELSEIIEHPAGGYLLGGSSKSDISGDKTDSCFGGYDFWIVKMSEDGIIEWDKTIGGSENDMLSDMIVHQDTTIVLAGHSNSDSSDVKSEDSRGDNDFWAVAVDLGGEIEWQKTIGGDLKDDLHSIESLSDGGILLSGDTYSDISGDKLTPLIGVYDYWMVKLNEDGEFDWDYSIGGDFQNAHAKAVQTLDGNIVICGTSNSDIGGLKSEPRYDISIWALKFSPYGDLLWENTLAGEDLDFFTELIKTSDGGVAITGYSNSIASVDKSIESEWDDYWIIKLDVDGRIIWEKTIQAEYDDSPAVILEMSPQEYVVGGFSESGFAYDKYDTRRGGMDYWILKLGQCPEINDSVVTYHLYGSPYLLTAVDTGDYSYQWYRCSPDGLILLEGDTNRVFEPDTYEYYFYTVRVYNDSCETYSECILGYKHYYGINEETLEPIGLYPNPTNDWVKLDVQSPVFIEVYDLQGQLVQNVFDKQVSLENLERGAYLFVIFDEDRKLLWREIIQRS
jgi:hypothetical protein